MKLLSLGAISPYGSSLEEHCASKKKNLSPKTEEKSFMVLGETRRAKVERAVDVKRHLPVPDGVLRRMSLSAQMSLNCTEETKEKFSFDSKKVGVLVGNTYGPAVLGLDYVKRLVQSNYRNASPNLFAQSVHNNLASTIAMTYALKGPTVTFVQKENLWTSLMQTADLWIEEESVDYLWIVLGNEHNTHIPYGQLYKNQTKQASYETVEGCLIPGERLICTESFAAFLLGSDSKHPKAVSFSLDETQQTLAALSQKKDMPLVKPEHVGISLAEHYFEKYFQ